MANKWFEETFLPSLEQRMNNPKYPNSCILSDRQAMYCEKYMTEKPCTSINGKDFVIYTYTLGKKHYTLYYAGRYTFLHMEDDETLVWYIRPIRSEEDTIVFKTEKELQDFIDENVDEDTGIIKGYENLGRSWTTGRRHTA